MTALLRGELIKTVTTRTLFGYAALGVALAIANVLIFTLSKDLVTVADKQEAIAGLPMLLILFGLVGAAGEYRHRTAAPAALAAGGRRGRLLLARAGAYAVTGLVLGTLTAAVALALGLPLLGGEPGPGLGSGEIAAVAAGSVVGAGLCAIMGVAAGALVRNQVAGVVGALILMFVGMPLLNIADETAAELSPFGAAVVLAGDPTGRHPLLGRGRAGAGRLDRAAPARGDRRRAPARPGMSDPARARLDERRPRGRRSFAFDLALALLATVAELAQVIGATGTPRAPALVLAVVAGGALVLRRTAPLAVLATTLAATVAIVALGDDPSGLSLLIALYTTAALCERRVSLAALVADGRDRRAALCRHRGRPWPGDLRLVRRDHRRRAHGRHLGVSAPTPRRSGATGASSRSARPPPSASASSSPGSPSTRSGRRSPVSCTTSSPTR